jgi:hypothetical protein
LTIHRYLEPRLRMSAATRLLALYGFMTWKGKKFTFVLHFYLFSQCLSVTMPFLTVKLGTGVWHQAWALHFAGHQLNHLNSIPKIQQLFTNFPKLNEPSQTSRHQKGDMKQVIFPGPTNIRRHSTKFSLQGDLLNP